MRTHVSLLAIVCLLPTSPLAAAGFTASAWNGDATSRIDPITNQWAYRFGSTASTTVNGVSVFGISGVTPSNPGSFSFTGSTATIPDINNLTSGSDGSASIASNFLFGGPDRTITLEGLSSGVEYTATIFAVGWEDAIGFRTATFSSGADSMVFDQHSFGQQAGFLIEYNFTATASTRTISITAPTPSSPTFHIYGLALRKEPIVVQSASDTLAAVGTLRQAVTGAPDGSLITFAPALSGSRIPLVQFNFLINKRLTIDATALANPIHIDAQAASRAIVLSTNDTQIDITSTTGSTATQSATPNGLAASLALDGNPSTFSEAIPDSQGPFAEPGDPLFWRANFNRDITLGSLQIINRPGTTETGRLSNLTVELINRSGQVTWRSSTLNFRNGARSLNEGPSMLTVAFPPQRVHSVRISGDALTTGSIRIAELRAFGPQLTLRGLTFENGLVANGSGGAISIQQGASASIEDCKFQFNEARFGGAVDNGGSLFLGNSEFVSNRASGPPDDPSGTRSGLGGAIFNSPTGTTMIEDSTFRQNTATGRGGALAFLDGFASICQSSFSQNSSSGGSSGAILVEKARFTMESSELQGNSAVTSTGAHGGGAMQISDTSTLIDHCLFDGNSFAFVIGGVLDADSGGGAIRFQNGNHDVRNCRFIGNDATIFFGGAILWQSSGSLSNSLFKGNEASSGGGFQIDSFHGITATNLTLSGNRASTGGAIFRRSDSNLILNNSIVWNNLHRGFIGEVRDAFSPDNSINSIEPSDQYFSSVLQGHDLTGVGSGNFNGLLPASDPRFAKPIILSFEDFSDVNTFRDSNLRLASDSPFIDAGNSAINSYPLDLAGSPRIVGSSIDMGATEFQGSFDEVDLILETDTDGDGVQAGIEAAIGTDPFSADLEHPHHLRIFRQPNGNVRLTFGVDLAQQSRYSLTLKRGESPDSINTFLQNNISTSFVDEIQIWNEQPNGRRFFRLEVFKRP
ncbi:choice-of-anchor Q domain-containing protein [Haloferula sp.]|uniref:choice-of-anchor Q domain-containing protein n=1 Tax=Haloferula sp. TaxID=2497595 RepID=UPI003C77B126